MTMVYETRKRERNRVLIKLAVWLALPILGAFIGITVKDAMIGTGVALDDARYWQGWICGTSVALATWFLMQGMRPPEADEAS